MEALKLRLTRNFWCSYWLVPVVIFEFNLSPTNDMLQPATKVHVLVHNIHMTEPV